MDASAIIGDGVCIGPFSVIGPNVKIGNHCTIESHVVLKGPTDLGHHNHIYQFATVGEATPDLKYKGEATRLLVGDHNIIREGVTIHRGTVQGRSETTMGNHNLIMAYAHIGHDSVVGNNVILVNNASLAGHVVVDDWAILSGYTLVHQFCHIGAHAFTGMATAIGKDVAAYLTVYGNPAEVRTINTEGLKRRGFGSESINAIKQAFKTVFRKSLKLEEALAELEQQQQQPRPEVQVFINSIKRSQRGIVR